MKHLKSKQLLAQIKNLVAQERKITLALIEHLEEAQARKLYAELGYGSLWEFATLELGLSEGAAQRRIQAMRLVRDVPEAKKSLADGKLSLSNAAKIQSFRQVKKKQGQPVLDPQSLVTQMESLSQSECEQKLFEISPEAIPQERERTVTAEGAKELKLVVSPELYDKLQRLKGLLAHAKPEASYAELIEYATDQALAKIEKKKGIARTTHTVAAATPTAAAAVKTVCAPGEERPSDQPDARKRPLLPAGRRVYLPVDLTRPIWARSHGQCEVTQHGRRCTSRYRLEIDHITPLAHQGANDSANLRVVCREHNQHFAVKLAA